MVAEERVMADVSGTRPFLEGPLDVEDSETLLQWINYLGTTFGTAGALCSLRYYEQLSWISADARREVEQHLQGLSLEETHSKKYDEPGHPSGPLSSLAGTPFGAHAKSLAFISTLADDDLRERIFPDIRQEYEDTVDIVTEITGRDSLLKREWLEQNLDRRNPYVDPLNLLQVRLLAQSHLTETERRTLRLTVQGIAAGMKNTG